MTDAGDLDPNAPSGTPRPEWEESFSREIEELASVAEMLRIGWNKVYPEDCFQNAHYLKQYSSLVQGHAVVRAFGRIYARASGSPETAEIGFPDRFQRSLAALAEGDEFAGRVPVGLFYYLEEAVSQGRAQKRQNHVPDPDPIARVLEFGKEILNHPALGAFRMDILEQFPSKALPTGTPPDADPAKDPGEPIQIPRSLLPKGYRLGKLEVERLIGEGGFAQVYLVYYPALADWRAAKAFTKLQAQGHEVGRLRKAFFDECRLQNQLKHPNIVRVLDVDEHEGYLVLIMEYVDGRDLASLIEERRHAGGYFSPQEILRVAIDITKALIFAHSQEIVHRDIKPANILIDASGVAKVTDFGLAKTLNGSGERRTTRLGSLIGTPHYMAPEQIIGDTYGPGIDLYSLGALLYHMALGEPPFRSKDPWGILDQHRIRKPVPIGNLREDFPEDLGRIILKLLEKSPDDRHKNAALLLRDLEACQATLGDHPAQATKRRRSPLLLVATSLFALLVGGFSWALFHRPSSGEAARATETSDLPKGSVFPAREPLKASDPGQEGRFAKIPEKKIPEPSSTQGNTGSLPAARNPEPPVPPPAPKIAVPSLREQWTLTPARPAEAALLSEMLDLFSKYRREVRARDYRGLEEELRAFEDRLPSQNEPLRLEIGAAHEIVRLAAELVQARLLALAHTKEPVQIKLSDGTVAAGVVSEVLPDRIILLEEGTKRSNVSFSRMAPEEFLLPKAVPQAEIAFQALSGDAAKALANALLLEKTQERILLSYPPLVRLARLDIEERVQEAVRESIMPLAEGKHPEPREIPSSASAFAAMKAFAFAEERISPLYGNLAKEFDRCGKEQESLRLLLEGKFSKILTAYPETQAHAAAAQLMLALFLLDFESTGKGGAPPKADELIADGGWMRYGWQLHPDEKTVTERQEFWQLDAEKEGSILRSPEGVRSLIMVEPHSQIPTGILLRFGFETLGEPSAPSEWRFLVLSDDGRDNYLRFDAESLSLVRKSVTPSGPSAVRLTSVRLPPPPGGSPQRLCALIPGDGGLHVFVDGTLAATLPKKECILPAQIQFSVSKGKLVLRSILARGKK